MILVIVIGIFLAGLILVDKLREPSEPWNIREAYQHFHKDRERWRSEGRMLYEHL